MNDGFLQFSDAQTLTVSAFATNVIDLGPATRNIGDGNTLSIALHTPTELDSAGEAVTLRVLALLSSWNAPKAFATDFATDNRLDVTAHGLAVGQRVILANVGGGLPAPLAAGTLYYVESVPSANEITLTATKGGAVVALSSNGTGTHALLSDFQITGDSSVIDEDDLEAAHGTGLLGGAAAGIPAAFPLRALPASQGRRYLHLYYAVSTAAPFTAGTVTAFLTPWAPVVPGNYPSALVI